MLLYTIYTCCARTLCSINTNRTLHNTCLRLCVCVCCIFRVSDDWPINSDHDHWITTSGSHYGRTRRRPDGCIIILLLRAVYLYARVLSYIILYYIGRYGTHLYRYARCVRVRPLRESERRRKLVVLLQYVRSLIVTVITVLRV